MDISIGNRSVAQSCAVLLRPSDKECRFKYQDLYIAIEFNEEENVTHPSWVLEGEKLLRIKLRERASSSGVYVDLGQVGEVNVDSVPHLLHISLQYQTFGQKDPAKKLIIQWEVEINV